MNHIPYVNLIPKPKEVRIFQGEFILQAPILIACDMEDIQIMKYAEYLERFLIQYGPCEIRLLDNTEEGQACIAFEAGDTSEAGYSLNVSSDRISIRGSREGILSGIQTLYQVIWFCRRESGELPITIPCCYIADAPRFEWRGLMLDCSRHFLSVDWLKYYIDIMAMLKMNRLHLHLADNEGWRIEIKKYPELTATGAFTEQEESRQGFYTQEELKDLVTYAEERNILIIPEVEVPGHSYAAVKSYPDLCCTGKPERNKGHQKDLYCAGKEEVFEFLESVLDEVFEIFPAPYIHLGGDEAPKEKWKECALCQERIKKEELNNEEELQSYMFQRLARTCKEKGKEIIGWEEILDGNPDKETIVHWWRYRNHGAEACVNGVRKGHRLIASPNSLCYLNFPVAPDENFKPERTSTMEKVYSAEYIPEELEGEERNMVLGAQCCLWTEFITENDISRMLFPRILACAELMWTYPEKRDFKRFRDRVYAQEGFWNMAGIEYGPDKD